MSHLNWDVLFDRALWMGIGIIIGTALGYTVRARREAREALGKVEALEKELHPRDEGGLMRLPRRQDTALFIIVVITVWAAIVSGNTSSRLGEVVNCSVQFNEKQGVALNGRDVDAKGATQSEIDLWKKYIELFDEASKADSEGDQKKVEEIQIAFYRYIKDTHITNLEKLQEARDDYPYPKTAVLRNCSNEGE